MNWKAIQENELNRLVQEDLSQMNSELRQRFAEIQTPPYYVSCDRGGSFGPEKIFVLACAGERLLIYDDVEDEYGIACRPKNPASRVKNWELFVNLESALTRLQQRTDFERSDKQSTG